MWGRDSFHAIAFKKGRAFERNIRRGNREEYALNLRESLDRVDSGTEETPWGIWGDVALKTIAVVLIKAYRKFISPLFPPTCRFYPTCSAYFIQALEKYGFIKGSILGIKRLLKCHPFHPGGYDPLK
jgi:putative membrane protein insertion efficiency factor